ncbi:hypothetical protein GN958_ATG14890 [Phytophthora infestans]|uniref:SWIM-type domain-containing protein n=1 Tax=Phytophthora infestans TaxID=4787 RepID=A0A8S9UAC7_PHYIN|nr:hypothetical protein GN958_ATG14890 [Phytophthora infestans]
MTYAEFEGPPYTGGIREELYSQSRHVGGVRSHRRWRGFSASSRRAQLYPTVGASIPRGRASEAQLLYQSLYRVQVLNSEHDPFEVSPKWSADDIRMVRQCYVCDCSESRQSGWMCEHIVATMALLEKISIDALLSVLPVRRRPGGQFKSRGALARTRFNKSDARFFGVSHLEQLFMESTAAPTHWHVTKEFSVKNRGQVLREHVPRHVDRWLEMAVAISGRSSSQPEKWSL